MRVPSLKIEFTAEERRWILERIDDSLASGQISQGKNVESLEKAFAEYVGAKHAIACNSGSSALEIVLRVLHVESQEVLVPTNTFVATATAVLFAGGSVRLVDADPSTFGVTLADIQNRVTERTAGVILVHIGGIITPQIEAIRQWCDEHGLWLLEDCAHAHGSFLDGRAAGRFGIAGCYSFFATKVVTAGEGGIIVTDDDHVAEAAILYRNHGKPEPWVSFHTQLGGNWRMSELTAPVALAQLRRLSYSVDVRQDLADMYTGRLKECLPDVQLVLPNDRSSWYKYILLLPNTINRAQFKEALAQRGVGLQGEVYAIPLHMQPVMKPYVTQYDLFPHAERICSQHICLPIYTSLTQDDVEFVVDTLSGIIAQHL